MKLSNVRLIVSGNFVLILLVSFGLTFSSINCGSRLGLNLFHDDDDVRLGQQLDQEIRANPQEYPLLETHPHVTEYINAIGARILESTHIQKRDVYPYIFSVIHDDSTINAFAAPGGYIYIYTGLLHFLDDEATLAGVIAHEIAHAERRHATRRISAYYGVEILLGLVLGENPGLVAQIAANLFTGLGFLANSRSDEYEADHYAMLYLEDTDYYPGAIRRFFDKVLERQQHRGGTVERLLSTHPLPQDRVDRVEKRAAEQNYPEPTDENLFIERYREFKKTLP